MESLPLASDAAVEISHLHFRYGEREILRDINLRIPQGAIVAIMGQSGCGKTTLLRLIGGQLRASQGSLLVDGEDMRSIDDAGLYRLRRRMGMLFQFGALFTDMSVFDNVAFQMREHTALSDALIRDLTLMKLEAVGLRGVRDRMPGELSGGMARRAALARAIALDPRLMMYDEPFTGLDPISMSVISRLIRELNRALGTTSIIVTHDVQESLRLVDHVYLVSQGVIVADGTPDEIRASGLPYVHQFIWGEMDGPVPFHYPAPPISNLLGKPVPAGPTHV
jgi:phospholipid/cholesterol/gamma-HCH transport system ATP-binding protein